MIIIKLLALVRVYAKKKLDILYIIYLLLILCVQSSAIHHLSMHIF